MGKGSLSMWHLSEGLKLEGGLCPQKSVCGCCTPGGKNKCRYVEVKTVPKACLNTGNGRIRNTRYQGGRTSKRPEGRNGGVRGEQGEMGREVTGQRDHCEAGLRAGWGGKPLEDFEPRGDRIDLGFIRISLVAMLRVDYREQLENKS